MIERRVADEHVGGRSAYIRIPFTVADPADTDGAEAADPLRRRLRRLSQRHADYFRRTANCARASLAFQFGRHVSRSPNRSAIVYEDIDLTASKNLLVAGNNVLAIHGLNRTSYGEHSGFPDRPRCCEATRPLPPVTGYMVTPTPSAANQAGHARRRGRHELFGRSRVLHEPVQREITTATPGAEIRYTTDGSTPTATTGFVYNPASPPLITTTTTLRAAAFKDGLHAHERRHADVHLSGRRDPAERRRPAARRSVGLTATVPTGRWIPTSSTTRPMPSTIKDDLKAVPTVSLVMPWNDWFGGGGQGIYPIEAEIERAVSMEYFTGRRQRGVPDRRRHRDPGRHQRRPLEDGQALDAREVQGAVRPREARRRHFPRRRPRRRRRHELQHVHPRRAPGLHVGVRRADQRRRPAVAGDVRPGRLRRPTCRISPAGTAPHSRWVHLYINGLYWGMYEMHERPDEHFAESYLGGNDEDYDVIKHNPTNRRVRHDVNPIPLQLGDRPTMPRCWPWCGQDMTVPANYDAAAAKIDVDDFITYMVVNYYVGNDDWRTRTGMPRSTASIPTASGGSTVGTPRTC